MGIRRSSLCLAWFSMMFYVSLALLCVAFFFSVSRFAFSWVPLGGEGFGLGFRGAMGMERLLVWDSGSHRGGNPFRLDFAARDGWSFRDVVFWVPRAGDASWACTSESQKQINDIYRKDIRRPGSNT